MIYVSAFLEGLTVDYIKNCSATSKFLFKRRSCCEDRFIQDVFLF